MNSYPGLNKVHHIYRKTRYYFLALFVFAMTLLTFVSDQAYGDSVVGTVLTKINLTIDHSTKAISTTQNTLQGALEQNDITLNQNDITIPSLNTYLSGKEIDAEVIRAIPVLISDNGQSWVGMSAYTQPENILSQLNVEIYPEDRVSIDLILDVATEGLAGQKITIERAPVYTVYVDDTTKILRSWKNTVGEMLTEKGVSLGANDIVVPATASNLIGVPEITITRITYADVVETVTIPFQTVKVNDYNMYQGLSAVTQEGINGSKLQNVHIVYKNGVEVERTITSTEITKTAQAKIIAIGVKPYSHQDLWNIMLQAQTKYGVDPADMFSVMLCESGGNVYSGAGTKYQGLFQWDSSFYNWAAKAGVSADFFNPTSQIMATALRVATSGGWYAWGCKP